MTTSETTSAPRATKKDDRVNIPARTTVSLPNATPLAREALSWPHSKNTTDFS